ncbi:ABC transporter ATP-binding protein [Streptomyces iconiensis]|uniref:ABC transporter ATP-binding protein n=1 Tax=Streptomyces iconiensis TaxID=1384038 RepID=UPI003D2F8F46
MTVPAQDTRAVAGAGVAESAEDTESAKGTGGVGTAGTVGTAKVAAGAAATGVTPATDRAEALDALDPAALTAPAAPAVPLAPPDPVDALALSRTDFARRITLLAQSRAAPSGLSVREVVGFGRHPYRQRFRGAGADPDGTRLVEHALAVTDAASFADRGVETLSGGQLQRVWLACCLAQDTDVLLLDEPTTYLDLRYQVEILDLVRDLADAHGVTVGVVLHDLDQAASVADQIVLLSAGRVAATGTPAEVYDPALLSETYGIRIEVDHDTSPGSPRTRAVGRHHLRHQHTERP